MASDGDRDTLHWRTYVSITTLIPLATALVALLGAGFQYQLNQVRAARADLEAAQNAFRAEQAKLELTRLEEARAGLASTIDAMQMENDRISNRLTEVRTQLAEAEEGIRAAAVTATSGEARQALTQAQSTVATLHTTTNEAEARRADQAERLRSLRGRVVAPAAVESLRLQP
jgi:chromosome segregation ATPase